MKEISYRRQVFFFFFQDGEHVHTRARFMLMYGKQQLELDMEQQTGFI